MGGSGESSGGRRWGWGCRQDAAPWDAVAVLGRASKGLGGGGGSSSAPLPWERAVWQMLSAGCWPQPAVVSPFARTALQDGVDFISCPVPARVSLALRISCPATSGRCPLHTPEACNASHIEREGHVVTQHAQDGSSREVQCRPAQPSGVHFWGDWSPAFLPGLGVGPAWPRLSWQLRDRSQEESKEGAGAAEKARTQLWQGAKCGQGATFPPPPSAGPLPT